MNSDLYYVRLKFDELKKLESKAWEGKYLDVKVWVNPDIDPESEENYKAMSVVYDKIGEEKVYLSKSGKKNVPKEKMPF